MSQTKPDFFDTLNPGDIKQLIIDPTYQCPHLYFIFKHQNGDEHGTIINQHRYYEVSSQPNWKDHIFRATIHPGYTHQRLLTDQ